MIVSSLYENICRFINNEILSLCDWPEIEAIIANRQQARINSANAWVDILPSLACAACGGDVEKSIPLAAAWSLYIFAGRIVDDIHDDEGKGHLWNAAGTRQALPTALFVIGIAHMALARLQPPAQANGDILDAYGRVLSVAAQAQREQHSLSLDALSVEVYFNNLVSRTAMAFATAAWSGGKLASANPETLTAMYNFGLAVGIAIQIEDDCEDLVKSDLIAGIYTLPIIYGLSQTQHSGHSELVAHLSVPAKMSTSQVNTVAAILTEMKAFHWSRQMAGIYRVKAVEALAALPSGSGTACLRDFALGNCQV